ncbi:hypothetical protein ACFFUB_07180 [Algimonas porphyrae]|uniref:Uncharacterized protein n=1 Tax=Algimonas porphyrae TaxID=1128113 RepID=A0ABQ5V454_9PROT|nr:hypothetical protein [Algimonas porphyrae]GLQ21052.1 hypothetical protein GCM10007854_20070 [Algimonas porphyrae]
MERRHDSSDRRRGRRVSIILLAGLLSALIVMPALAPVIGGMIALVLLWGLIQHNAAAPLHGIRTENRQKQCEPALWDDGFGTT